MEYPASAAIRHFSGHTGISFHNWSSACLYSTFSLFPGKQSGGWQQQGVSLENNKHQNNKSPDLVVLPQKLFLHKNWIVSERLRFLLISLLKVATLDFCHSLSILFSAVSLLWLCICKYRDTQTYSCSSRSRLLSALPCLTHFGCLWNTGRAFPACKGKTPLCGFCCQGKDQAIDSKSTTSASQFSFINIITEIRTKTHLIQTDLKAGWWHIAESCQHKTPRRRKAFISNRFSRSRQFIYWPDLRNI